jgi:hypothetical protein
MTLIYDDFDDVYVWVESNNHNIELSPQYDSEEAARLWQRRIIDIVKNHDIQ